MANPALPPSLDASEGFQYTFHQLHTFLPLLLIYLLLSDIVSGDNQWACCSISANCFVPLLSNLDQLAPDNRLVVIEYLGDGRDNLASERAGILERSEDIFVLSSRLNLVKFI
ncbi:hypothetical protein NUU61_000563 [Penicillium alfredii]|uniref:Uncharacterized protein n=1 Tax=Penicillium alfredii TaxID=1506179 RepID=A0A9W9G9U7_9EURO|nr:uncharacterized protein NUU61_000563 [Penicillium alfredii]KAJ5114804.1 hypothetical protein NUU61_000563 [Penicillium alfredii]